MPREEVESLLDSIPVFAVTEPNKEGLVLLKEKNSTNDIAYFFFSAETANAVFAPLREKKSADGEANTWDVTQYPLGVVWFELISKPEAGIEYRLVPDAQELGGARKLLEEQAKQVGSPDSVPDVFNVGFNQVPVFIDQFLRIRASSDGEEKVPMYLSLQDLLTTCQQAKDASSGEYQASINVADLKVLVEQMLQESENDFRQAVLIPPTAQALKGKPTITPPVDEDADTFTTPTATDNWLD